MQACAPSLLRAPHSEIASLRELSSLSLLSNRASGRLLSTKGRSGAAQAYAARASTSPDTFHGIDAYTQKVQAAYDDRKGWEYGRRPRGTLLRWIIVLLFWGSLVRARCLRFRGLTGLEIVAIAAALTVLVSQAIRLLRRGKDAAKNAFPAEEQKRNDQIFGIVNAVTWVSVFLVFQIFPRFGLGELTVPAVVLIVGLHFFPMPPLFRHRSNLVTGAVMAIWAIFCAVVFHGDRMIGFAAAGAGVALWVSAIWALKTTTQLLRSAGL